MAIPLDRFSNSALTTLTAGLDNVTNPATMVVASAVGFPTSGSFRIISGTELFQVTAGAGTTSWTVTRQVEGTTIATHAIGDVVVHVVTAFEVNSLVQTFNVVAYLAKGDNSTDDKVPFQNAVNDAHAVTPGGWIFIPTAAYVIGSSLTTYSNVVFVTHGATFSGAGAASVAPLVNISLLGGLTLPALLTISTGGLTVSAGSIILPAASIADGALSSNAALKNINNSFSVGQTITGNSTITGTLGGITTLTATTLAGTLSTAAQPNITSVGILVAPHMTAPVVDSGGEIITSGDLAITAGKITMATAISQLIPGATSFSLRNNANSADNLIVTDAGAATFRSTVGGITTLTATTLAGTLSTAAQGSVTSLGILTSLTTSGAITMTAAASKIIPGATSFSHRNAADSADNLIITDAGVATFRGGFAIDAAGHLISTSAGTPATSALGTNVTSATFTGNDVRGTVAIVMSAGLAANTRCFTATFATSYGATSPKVTLVDQTSTAGLAIVNSYVQAQSTGVSFDIAFDQALVAGTYIIDYIVIG